MIKIEKCDEKQKFVKRKSLIKKKKWQKIKMWHKMWQNPKNIDKRNKRCDDNCNEISFNGIQQKTWKKVCKVICEIFDNCQSKL